MRQVCVHGQFVFANGAAPRNLRVEGLRWVKINLVFPEGAEIESRAKELYIQIKQMSRKYDCMTTDQTWRDFVGFWTKACGNRRRRDFLRPVCRSRQVPAQLTPGQKN